MDVKHRLRVFEKKVLRKTFDPNRQKVTGGRRRLLSEELSKLSSSTSRLLIDDKIIKETVDGA
jgi:hypothetical protein